MSGGEGQLFDPEAEQARQRGQRWLPKVRQTLEDPDREWQEEEWAQDEKLREEEEAKRRQEEEDAKGERTGDETLDESMFSAMRSLQTVPQGFQSVTGTGGGGGLSLRDAALIATAIAGLGLTGVGGGVAGGALRAAPAVGRAAAAGGTGLLALLGLAGPASAETPADASPAGAAVGALRDRSRGRSGRVGR